MLLSFLNIVDESLGKPQQIIYNQFILFINSIRTRAITAGPEEQGWLQKSIAAYS